MQFKVKVQKTCAWAKLPEMAHKGDSGFDLFASETVLLKPGERKLVGTGLKMEMPEGIEAQVRPKSGLAINYGISVLNSPGTVDSGYRGEVKVILANFGEKDFLVEKGSKIAQMVFARVECPEFEETLKLNETKRSNGGFGSTGLK
ncbi:MAG: dUTP diphosphatase [Candidatus Diapherotrites archaeon]